MKKLLTALGLSLLASSALAQSTKTQLNTEIDTQLPNNVTGAITPAILRGVLHDMVNSSATLPDTNTITNTLTITPPAGTMNRALDIIQSGAGSSNTDVFYNKITVTDSVETTAPAGFAIGFLTDFIVDGTTPKGLEKVAIAGFTSHFGAPADTGGDFIAIYGSARAASPNGGTNTGAGAKGTLYGSTMVAWAFSGATNYLVVAGAEYDVVIEAGASARHRWGLSLVGGGAVRGADSDAAIEIGSGNAATSAFKTGILFSNHHGSAPLPATGTVIGTDGASVTTTNFADFSTYTFTGNIFNFGSTFSVSGTGTVTGNLFSSYGGTSIVIQQDGGVAMLMAGSSAFRNSKNGASIMSFDVSTGGATHGSFQFNSSNGFTNFVTLASTESSFYNGSATITNSQSIKLGAITTLSRNSSTGEVTLATNVSGITVSPNSNVVQVNGEVRIVGDVGGAASNNTITGTSDLTANSTGTGTILFKGATNRNSSGFIKIYIGTTPYYIPVFSAITG